MKRDMDIIRAILLKVEESDNDGVTAEDFPDHNRKLVDYHLGLVMECGMAKGKVLYGDGETSYDLLRLTMHGHDFLNGIRDAGVWSKVKRELGDKITSVSFAVIIELATRIGKKTFGLDE